MSVTKGSIPVDVLEADDILLVPGVAEIVGHLLRGCVKPWSCERVAALLILGADLPLGPATNLGLRNVASGLRFDGARW